MKKIAIISPDAINLTLAPDCTEEAIAKFSKSTATGNRAQAFAKYLADDFNTTIFIPDLNYPGKDNIRLEDKYSIEPYDYYLNSSERDEDLLNKLSSFDCVILQSSGTTAIKTVYNLPKTTKVILDGWSIALTEFPAAISCRDDLDKKAYWDILVKDFAKIIERADLILYTNDSQRKFYEGILFYSGKQDYSYLSNSLLLRVPYGVENKPLVPVKKKSSKFKLLWYGAFYPWYHPLQLAECVSKLPEIELTFFGAKHPRHSHHYYEQIKDDAVFNSTNITMIEDQSLDDPLKLFSNYDACIMISKPWIESAYSSPRVRNIEILSRGMPMILGDTNSILKEYPYLDAMVQLVDVSSTETLTKDLKNCIRNERKFHNKTSLDWSANLLKENISWRNVLRPLIQYLYGMKV